MRGFSGRGGMLSRFRPHALTRPFSCHFGPFPFRVCFGVSRSLGGSFCCRSGGSLGSLGVVGLMGWYGLIGRVGRCGRSLSLGGLSVSFHGLNKCLCGESVFIGGLFVGWLVVMGSLSLLSVAVGLTLSGFSSNVHGVGSAVGSDAVGVGALMGWGLFRLFTLAEIGAGVSVFSTMETARHVEVASPPTPVKNFLISVYFPPF